MMTATIERTRTVLERLVEAGISEARARAHLAEGRVVVDGAVVTDPASPAGRPAHVDLRIHRRDGD